MLRLTRISEDNSTLTLRVEGRIVREWAAFLERECEALFEDFSVVQLDLSGVSYVDTNGLVALRRLRSRPLEISNTPPMIQQLLDGLP